MVQVKREEILKMFATFPENKLKEKIEFYNLALTQINEDMDYKKQYQFIFNQQHKRKTISMTTVLERFNVKTMLAMTVLFIIMIMYPIVNYIVTSQFIDEFTKNVNELSLTYFMKGNSAVNYASNYLYVSCKVQNCSQTYLMNPLREYLVELEEENDEKLAEMQYMAKNFEGTNRYGQADYEELFLKALQTNICDTLKNNKDKIKSTKTIDYEKCAEVYNGILNKGLIMSLTTIYQRFSELQQIYDSDLTTFKTQFKEFDQSIDFLGLDDVFSFIIDIIEMIRDFLLNKAEQYYNKQVMIQAWLFAYSIVCYAAIFLYGWYKFINHLSSLWQKTRYIIGIFQIDTLLANPYMVALLEKQKFK
eukprot:TRINITY_DN1391_c0_g1_i1.p1 TRINITY_DN1391_c0_g1~~TRINITY_DN1391_c0_g1_i1.p1  ORF type:complete len:362 (-),score=51.53 TRINITY_DN1391_c0_g1_i1:270-1355(-)